MDIIRPKNFEEIKGNESKIKRIRERTLDGTLSKLILICGVPGIGKTSTAYVVAKAIHCTCEDVSKRPCCQCKSCLEIDNMILNKEESTANVKLFSMPSEKAGDTVNTVISELNTDFIMTQKKTIIIDELQNLHESQQRDFLKPFESIPDGVNVIMCTTDVNSIIEALRSRSVTYRLKPLGKSELKWVLKKEAFRRHLEIENEDRALDLIMNWADYKAREALKCLEALGKGRNVEMEEIMDMIEYIPVRDIIPLITSFKGSYIKGIKCIENMTYDDSTKKSLKLILIDILKIANLDVPRHVAISDIGIIKEAIDGIPMDIILNFTYNVLAIDKFDSTAMMLAYLKAHPSLNKLTSGSRDSIMAEEASIASLRAESKIAPEPQKRRGGMERLMRQGKIVNRER